MNVFCFSGRLGKDLEIRYDIHGRMIGETSVALKDYVGTEDSGEAKYKTTWLSLVFRGEKRVMALQDSLWKGRKVSGSGRLSSRPYKVSDEKSIQVIYLEVDDIDYDPASPMPQLVPQTQSN